MFDITSVDGSVSPIVLIRVGATLATFATVNMKDGQGVDFPQPLLARQLEKLKTAATG